MPEIKTSTQIELENSDLLMIYCALTDEINLAYQKGDAGKVRDWQEIQARLESEMSGALEAK